MNIPTKICSNWPVVSAAKIKMYKFTGDECQMMALPHMTYKPKREVTKNIQGQKNFELVAC